jgi:glycine/D-amino acid oxidase-like deaminating enzyme
LRVPVVVVGGGVLGLMHAVEACQRGHHVVHLEREPGPRGASVRNFGLIWISGRAGGTELALARRPGPGGRRPPRTCHGSACGRAVTPAQPEGDLGATG